MQQKKQSEIFKILRGRTDHKNYWKKTRRQALVRCYLFNRPPHASAPPFSTLSRDRSKRNPCFLQWGPKLQPFPSPCPSSHTCRRGSFYIATDPTFLQHTQQSLFGCTSFVPLRSSARERLRTRNGTGRGTFPRTPCSRRHRAGIWSKEHPRKAKPGL